MPPFPKPYKNTTPPPRLVQQARRKSDPGRHVVAGYLAHDSLCDPIRLAYVDSKITCDSLRWKEVKHPGTATPMHEGAMSYSYLCPYL